MDKYKVIESELPIIIFNGFELPVGSVFIDYCASSRIFNEIDEEISLWFWRFTICADRERTEKSDIVLKYSITLQEMIVKNKSQVLAKLYKVYDNSQVEQILKWWLDSLDIMIKTAKKREVSSWIGRVQK